MKTKKTNLLGRYGQGIINHLPESPGPLSFLNSRWLRLSEWKRNARKKVLELVSKPNISGKIKVRLLHTYYYDNLQIEELAWSLPYGPETRAVFLKPFNVRGKLPGILALHDHGGIKYYGKSKIVKTFDKQHPFLENHQKEYYGGVAWANEIAKRGYGVLVHDVFPFESRKVMASEIPPPAIRRVMTDPLKLREITPQELMDSKPIKDYDVPKNEPISKIHAYNCFGGEYEVIIAKSLFSSGLTWPGVCLAEDQLALDYLCSRPDIDGNRIGCGGLSGGGLRTNYLAGLDERIKCSVTAAFMTTWRDFALFINFSHTWMVYIPLLPNYMDYPEVLGIRAPLPSLVLATKLDPTFTLEEVRRSGRLLERIYQKAKAEEAFKISYHNGLHKFDLPMQEEAYTWFDRWLK